MPQKINTEHLLPFTSPLKREGKNQRICICHCTFLQCLRVTGKLCLIFRVLTMNSAEVFHSDSAWVVTGSVETEEYFLS